MNSEAFVNHPLTATPVAIVAKINNRPVNKPTVADAKLPTWLTSPHLTSHDVQTGAVETAIVEKKCRIKEWMYCLAHIFSSVLHLIKGKMFFKRCLSEYKTEEILCEHKRCSILLTKNLANNCKGNSMTLTALLTVCVCV